jgi:6-phosphogluconolactonase
MKTVFLVCLFGLSSLGAAEVFHAYAPSRSTRQLLIFEAREVTDGQSLRIIQRVNLGFAAATIVAHPRRPLLYVAAGRSEKNATPGAVVALSPDGRKERVTQVMLKHGYSYLSLDRANRFLLGASYFDGLVDVYPLTKTGFPGKPVNSLAEGRRFAHAVLTSPKNDFVYIPYVKENNALYQYRFNPGTGDLTALEPRNANPPEGTGPRHIAYHPKLPIVYFSNEQHIGVSVYEQSRSGQLKIRQVCDAVAATVAMKGISSSDIVITPDGRFVFAGIRGHTRAFDRVSRYAVQADGELKLLGLTPADGIPWGFALSPDARYLLVTAFKGETLTSYQIGVDGSLTKVASIKIDKQISDIVTR